MSQGLLLIRAGSRLCALPLEHVRETLRPLPIEPLPGAPAFVLGASLLRGTPTPILDLGLLLLGEKLEPATRLVSVRTDGGRAVGILVSEVLGVQRGAAISLEQMPPLLQDSAAEAIETLGRLDDRLLTVLRTGRLVPESIWRLVAVAETSP